MAGMGSLVLQKLCVEWNISDAFWIGLCTAVGVLQLYHFFRPIDSLIVVLLCTLGILGVILNRNAFVRLIRRVSGDGSLVGVRLRHGGFSNRCPLRRSSRSL